MFSKEQDLTSNVDSGITSIPMINKCLYICSHQHFVIIQKEKHNKETNTKRKNGKLEYLNILA